MVVCVDAAPGQRRGARSVERALAAVQTRHTAHAVLRRTHRALPATRRPTARHRLQETRRQYT